MDIANSNLEPRKTNTREIKESPILRFELQEIKSHFDEDIEVLNEQLLIYDKLNKDGNTKCASLILNSLIVLLESAFDFYLHEITKFGVTKIFENTWKKTDKYKNIKISIELVEKAINGTASEDWFYGYINENYASTTMVSFESLKDQLNLIGLEWKKVANECFYEKDSTTKPEDKLKYTINALYKRRNIVAHQSSRKHENAEHYEITKEMVTEFINNIKKIVDSIYNQAISR